MSFSAPWAGAAWLMLALSQAAPPKTTVRGALPPGVHLEFAAVGSAERITVEGPPGGGAYSLELPSGRYDIFLVSPTRRVRGHGWLTEPEVELNAEPENPRPSSSVEYDLLAEWRVVDESGKGVGPARVALEAELPNGEREKLRVWIPAGDEEKEVSGLLETTPDGRFVFRARESRLLADRVVALRVTVEMKGYASTVRRLRPTLEFSPSGHFFARYPEEGVEIRLKKGDG